MSEFDDLLIAGLRVRQAENPGRDGEVRKVTWAGNQYPCCAGAAGLGKDLGLGGFALDADLIVIIILEDLGEATPPTPKKTLTYEDKSYRIERTTTPPGSCFIALACIDPTKGV